VSEHSLNNQVCRRKPTFWANGTIGGRRAVRPTERRLR
jgi:hypothetical protein